MLATVNTAAMQGINSIPAPSKRTSQRAGCRRSRLSANPMRSVAKCATECVQQSSAPVWNGRSAASRSMCPPQGAHSLGSSMDLAIAIGVLAASGQVPVRPMADLSFFGELGLDGRIRSTSGALSLCTIPPDYTHGFVVPFDDAAAMHASMLQTGHTQAVLPAADLRSVASVLDGRSDWPPAPSWTVGTSAVAPPDMADVAGNPLARKAVEVAAAGGHHILLVGPIGSGRLLISRRIHGMLPELTEEQSQEVSRIWSAAGMGNEIHTMPPWRAPHYSAKTTALIGGGSAHVRPGEFSLAHHGVLCFDEINEFSAFSLDVLRAALNDGTMRVARGNTAAELPAKFLFVATMSPCPCGKAPEKCVCTETIRRRYLSRLAGPIIDRLDLRVPVVQPTNEERAADEVPESSAVIAARVARARERAADRGGVNAALPIDAIGPMIHSTPGAAKLLRRQLNDGLLSTRGADRVKRVALTLCDLADEDPVITKDRLEEALDLRPSLSSLSLQPNRMRSDDVVPA